MRFKEEIETEYFQKDFTRLLKKYRTLTEDFDNFINFSLEPFLLDNINNKCAERISNLGIKYPEIWKVKKFSSRSFKGEGIKSGIRIIFQFALKVRFKNPALILSLDLVGRVETDNW